MSNLLRALGVNTQTGGLTGDGLLGGFVPQAHGGGVPGYSRLRGHRGGLRQDELIVVLKRGEEVLTRGDPRHRFNFGYSSYAMLRSHVARLPRFHEGGVAGGDGRRGGMGMIAPRVTVLQ